MTIEDLWLSHSHRVNADDSEKYMDEEDFKIAILEWESAKTVSRVELPVKPEIADKLKELLRQVYDVLAEAPELNMSNYDHDQVALLNNKMVEAYCLLNYEQKQFSV